MVVQNPNPLITTIIPTFRRPKLLRRAINSVLRQTYPHFQICVFDNASGDETGPVVAEFAKTDSRVKYHCRRENIGPGLNFAYAMESVETPYFSVLSDDDVLLPSFYQTALAGFERWPEAVCSVTATVQVYSQGHVHSVPISRWKPGLYRPPEGMLAMVKYSHPEWTSVLFRKEAIQMAGGLDPETGGPSDLDFELRLAARYPIVVSKQPGALFVVHPEGCSSTPDLSLFWPGGAKMIRNLVQDEHIPAEARAYAERVLSARLKSVLTAYGLGSLARRNLDDAFKVAEVLGNHYGLRTRARLLRAAASACRLFPPARYPVAAVRKLRSSLRDATLAPRRRQLQQRYGAYVRYLDF